MARRHRRPRRGFWAWLFGWLRPRPAPIKPDDDDEVPALPREPLDVVVGIRFKDGIVLPYASGTDLEDALRSLLGTRYDAFEREFPDATFAPRHGLVGETKLQELAGVLDDRSPDLPDPGWLRSYSVRTPPDTDPRALVAHLDTWKDVLDRVRRINGLTVVATLLNPAEDTEEAKLHYQKRSFRSYVDDTSGVETRFDWGVDVEYAWSVPGGTGDGGTGTGPGGDTGLADVEKGWELTHGDLPGHIETAVAADRFVNGQPGDEDDTKAHGTNVLGILVAESNEPASPSDPPDTDTIGIAHDCGQVAVSGEYFRNDAGDVNTDPDPAAAIVSALAMLHTYCPGGGGVLLLETSDWWGNYTKDAESDPGAGVPIEFRKDVWDEIKSVTGSWHTVVEAAGNAGENLDTLDYSLASYPTPEKVDPADPPVEINDAANDSGAILVGATQPPIRSSAGAWHLETGLEAKHWKHEDSCHGKRVDCYAWGDFVQTTDSPGTEYTKFKKTSAASAIIAGVAVILQGIYRAATGGSFLKPDEIRDLLSDETLGTPVYDPDASDDIATAEDERVLGTMPDLYTILTKGAPFLTHGLVPDVFMRDAVGDTGDPHSLGSSKSPDIIVRTASEPDPAGEWGEDTTLRDDVNLSEKVIEGREHFVYVRATNRGKALARDVNATVYWSEVASLVTPSMWHEIGEGGASFEDMPPDDELKVSSELVWPADPALVKGHYCFVALIGAAGDPKPSPGDFADFGAFKEFIQGDNNAVWRNFNVVEPDPASGDIPPMPFWTPGAFDGDEEFDMEIWIEDASRVTVEVEMEPATLERFGMTLDAVGRTVDPSTGNSRLDVNGVPSGHGDVRAFGRARFPQFSGADPEAAGVDRMTLHVTFGALTSPDPVEIDVVQKHGGVEVGRVAWLVYPRAVSNTDSDTDTDNDSGAAPA
ncbi:MAG: S8 family serine peptidase [Planctomycetota bacterium]|jgi:hypothetical protein